MYCYNVGYDSYEESEHVVLLHEKKYSEDDIIGMIATAVIEIFPKHLSEFDDAATEKYMFTYQQYHPEVIDWLVMNKGFTKLKYDCHVSIFGWASMIDEADWKNDNGGDLKKLRDALFARGATKDNLIKINRLE